MSFVTVGPEAMLAKAADLADIASTIQEANTLAATPTTSLEAAAGDQVSAAIATLYGAHAEEYQALSTQMTALHNQLVQTLTANGTAYADTEAANAQQSRLTDINVPVQTLLR